MASKRQKPGSPKGQLKPLKRVLDQEFPARLQMAIDRQFGLTVPQLAARIRCTRAVLRKYLNGRSKTIEALLLFNLADALSVSARWLLTGKGAMEETDAFTPDQVTLVKTINQLVNARVDAKRRKNPGPSGLN